MVLLLFWQSPNLLSDFDLFFLLDSLTGLVAYIPKEKRQNKKAEKIDFDHFRIEDAAQQEGK